MQRGFQSVILKYWQAGFIARFPLQAEGQVDKPSPLSVGKFDFSTETFPLYLTKFSIDYPVTPDNILFDKLFKEAKGIKERKFTALNGAFLRLTPRSIPDSQILLQVPSSYAEEFKRHAISRDLYVYCIVDFESQPSTTFTRPAFTKQFDEQKDSWDYARSPQLAKEDYSRIRGKPIEFFHLLELKFFLRGFRIVDENQAILFEWVSNDVTVGQWADTTANTASTKSFQVGEKVIDPSLIAKHDVPWKKEMIIAPFQFEASPVTNAEFRSFVERDSYICFGKWGTPLTVWKTDNGIYDKSSIDASQIPSDAPATRVAWNDCDFYLKRRGKRLPKVVEWQEAFLMYGQSQVFDFKVFGMEFEEICFDPIVSKNRIATIGARMKLGEIQWFGSDVQRANSSSTAGFRGFFK